MQHPTTVIADFALNMAVAGNAARRARADARLQAAHDEQAVSAVHRLGAALRASQAREADLRAALAAATARAARAEGLLLRLT